MLRKEVDLTKMNTLWVACRAKVFTEILTTYGLLQLLQLSEWKEEKHWILWWGANTLFLSDFFDGLVIKNEIKWFKLLSEDNWEVLLQVGAGEDRDDLIRYCLENRFVGLENLVAIPWKVGASVVSNIGAYGQEVGEVVAAVMGVNTQTWTIQKLTNNECNFAYRESIFKQELQDQFIVTQVIFRLRRLDSEYVFSTSYWGIQDFFDQNQISFDSLNWDQKLSTLVAAITQLRKDKLPDPQEIGTAWSFFKNPEVWLVEREVLHEQFPLLHAHLTDHETMKLSAWALIEYCGWKGKVIGWVKMSEKHALILVNTWKSGSAIAQYADQVQQSVFETFWIRLEPEVRYCI